MEAKNPVVGVQNMEGRVNSVETAPAAAPGAAPAQPPAGRQKIPEVRITLEPLYFAAGGCPTAAWRTLKAILDAWEVRGYVLLYNASRDIDVQYLDDEFAALAQEFERKCSWEDDWLSSATIEYARRKGARAVVVYFDGYEEAAAVLQGGEE